MAGRGTREQLSPFRGPLQPSWPALAGLTLVAVAGFIGVGFLLGVPRDQMGAYAGLVVTWWVATALALGLSVPTVSTWPPAAMAAAQAFTLVLTWAATLALSLPLGLAGYWERVGLRLPVCIILVAGFGQVLRGRELAALARAEEELELARLEAETSAIIDAHAAIVEEARAASTDVAAAVRAAMRMMQGAEPRDPRVRRLIDGEVRRRASAAGRRVHQISTSPSPPSPTRLRRLGPALDDLAYAPHWHIPFAFLLLLATMLLVDVHHPRWQQTAALVTLATLAGCVVSYVLALVVRPRLPSWPTAWRRAAFPLVLLAGLAIALPLSGMTHPDLGPWGVAASSLTRLPAALAVVALPGAYSASTWRSRVGMSEASGQIVLALARRDMVLDDLERARRSIISILHTHVQGRAAAALTALDLADAGVPGTAHIAEAVLAELAELDIDARSQEWSREISTPSWTDPVAAIVASWQRVLAIDLRESSDLHTADPSWDAVRYRLAMHIEDALVNAAIHGRARAVWITIATGNQIATVTVADDGVGLPAQVRPGLGLHQMAERGGTWSLQATEGGGSVLTLTVPLPPRAHEQRVGDRAVRG